LPDGDAIKKADRRSALRGGAKLLGPNSLDVLSLKAFVARYDIEVDFLAFVEGFEAGSHDGRVVNEDVLTGVLGNEAESLLVIEPLDFAASHICLLGWRA
jgi:hypothetical protein